MRKYMRTSERGKPIKKNPGSRRSRTEGKYRVYLARTVSPGRWQNVAKVNKRKQNKGKTCRADSKNGENFLGATSAALR